MSMVIPCSLLLATAPCSADPIDDVLSGPPYDTPELVATVQELIRENPQDPRIFQLRLLSAIQRRGRASTDEEYREVIEYLHALADDAPSATQVRYRAQVLAGDVYLHNLRAWESAYEAYLLAEDLIPKKGRGDVDLERDYQRVTLYLKLAQSGHLAGKPAAVDKYARLVMAYPYLGMDDREMYRKFYELYGDAAQTFLSQFSRDEIKLLSIEIYPSHPRVYRKWRRMIADQIGADELDDMLTEQVSALSSAAPGPQAEASMESSLRASSNIDVPDGANPDSRSQRVKSSDVSGYWWQWGSAGTFCGVLGGGIGLAWRRWRIARCEPE